MELKIENGDYVPAGGGFVRQIGAEALLARVLFRLSAKRGGFALLPEMGSDLWKLPLQPKSRWDRAALSAVTTALAEEPVTVSGVTVTEQSGHLRVAAQLKYNGEALVAEVLAI